jgi:hypothetical protein
VPCLREILTQLLRHPAPGPRQIVREITALLQRNQEARIYHWHAVTGCFPPRLNPGGSG